MWLINSTSIKGKRDVKAEQKEHENLKNLWEWIYALVCSITFVNSNFNKHITLQYKKLFLKIIDYKESNQK